MGAHIKNHVTDKDIQPCLGHSKQGNEANQTCLRGSTVRYMHSSSRGPQFSSMQLLIATAPGNPKPSAGLHAKTHTQTQTYEDNEIYTKIKSLTYVLGNVSLSKVIKAIFQRREEMLYIIYKNEHT